jgi:RNA polymerase sigma factor (sigma-70 family)
MPETRARLFVDLFARNRRELFTYFARRVGSDDAADLLQETFVRALRYERIQTVVDPPAFLQRIATNLLRDLTRRRKVEQQVIDARYAAADAATDADPPEQRIDVERRSRELLAAIDALPARSREVLSLALNQGLPPAVIAARLGITENAARKQLRRAILRCRAAVR